MGAFYGSVQVRSENRGGVKAVAESVASAMGVRCLVGPAIDGWIGLYPDMNGQNNLVGAAVAKQIDADVLHLIVHDDDVFAYWLYRSDELVDSFWSLPGYFGEENLAQEEAMSGQPEAFRPILGGRIERMTNLLVRGEEQDFSATELLEEFAKVLRISNVVSAYEYLKAGETEGIKKWKLFEEVPAEQVVAGEQTARSLRKEVDLARNRLKSDGLLLLHDERKKGGYPYGCAVGCGFVVAWSDTRLDNVELLRYKSSWGETHSLELETSKHVTDIASAAAQERIAVSAGDCIHVFEATEGEWSRVADIPEGDLTVGGCNFSRWKDRCAFIPATNRGYGNRREQAGLCR